VAGRSGWGFQVDGLFDELNDQATFKKYLIEHFTKAPNELTLLTCTNQIDEARVDYAFGEYQQNLEKFSVLLKSKNPDHYKRAGALLHALYQSDIVTATKFDQQELDDLETGFMMVSHGDAQHMLSFIDFYLENHNQILAFDFAYQCCDSYEKEPCAYDIDYLLNVCRFQKANPNMPVDVFFMLFKSLMLSIRPKTQG
jgi:hypothetical protein